MSRVFSTPLEVGHHRRPPIRQRIGLLTGLTIALVFIFVILPYFSLASVVINEVLFDPEDSDTGQEAIELYNPYETDTDLSGWELYPDGIGYFSFPQGFSLGAKSFAVIHLRTSGTDDSANLYHSLAGANMGNSSGSVALFKPGGRSKDTIVDFLRWHKPGASERKTWESTAVEAGIWIAGTFIDISSIEEGNSIGLSIDGHHGGAGTLKIYSSPSISVSNGANGQTRDTSPGQVVPSRQSTSTINYESDLSTTFHPTPSLGADAGVEATVLAGAFVQFYGMAFGLDGQPLSGARFLWNFGDGSLAEGKNTLHVYGFPGVYHANLNVSSGEYSGSDWRTITVIPHSLTVSEIMPGEKGFVEVFNLAGSLIDLGGLALTDELGHMFRVPARTVVSPQSVIVFANSTTGLNPSNYLALRDARGELLEEIHFSDSPLGSSYERRGSNFVTIAAPNPGEFNTVGPLNGISGYNQIRLDGASIIVPPAIKANAAVTPPAADGQSAVGGDKASINGSLDPQSPAESSESPQQKNLSAASFGGLSMSKIFFALAIAFSLIFSMVFVLLKRKSLS